MEESSKKNGNNRTFDTNKTAPYWQNNLMQYPVLVVMDLHKMNPKFFNSLLFKSQLTANDSLRCSLSFQCQHYQARWGSALSVLHDRRCGLIQAFLQKDKWLCWTFCSLSECSLKPHLSLKVEANHVNSLWQSRDKAKIFGLRNEHVWFFSPSPPGRRGPQVIHSLKTRCIIIVNTSVQIRQSCRRITKRSLQKRFHLRGNSCHFYFWRNTKGWKLA